MKKSDKPAEKPDLLDLDLDLPDWSGMVENPSRMSAQASFELCEQYWKWFPEASRHRQDD
jgi:hypothetical protein